MNPTIRKFGHPGTLIREYRHWMVLLRPAQATLGALVLASADGAHSLATVPAEGFAELARVCADIEAGLDQAFGFERLNYLALMMVDPDVHFHVLPRHAGAKSFAGVAFTDPGWPGPPRLDHENATDPVIRQALIGHLRRHWPE